MFYSQFILAKKGPLGTIWIAAHLERKLRKNQVADTDIGVSVDSILFPDVPIALRLSSHLLLGVVRIYSRKVNYLFDDCSEALLKIKQAFRSTAVDLPPEESTAPYHSITLPETFDLDDFELPDNEIFQGNYVDHHISSREQITLQDSLEGVAYSTSKFGLDERFGDGDTSGLDLDEELFLEKVASTGHDAMSADPQASVEPMTPLKQDEYREGITASSEMMVEGFDGDADYMDYAHAPCTPRLIEEPNLSNIQETSACDDHLELEDHPLPESTVKENLENISSKVDHGGGNEHNWHFDDDTKLQCQPAKVNHDNVSIHDPDSTSAHPSFTADHVGASSLSSEMTDRIFAASDGEYGKQDVQNGFASNDDDRGTNGIGMEESARDVSGSPSICKQVLEDIPLDKQASNGTDLCNNGEIPRNLEQSCPRSDGLEPESQDRLCVEKPETDSEEPKDSNNLNVLINENVECAQVHFLRPCNAGLEKADLSSAEGGHLTDPKFSSDVAGFHPLGTSSVEETSLASASSILAQGEMSHAAEDSEQTLKENHIKEPDSSKDINMTSGKSHDLLDNLISGDSQLENTSSSAGPELPPPEKLLSIPGVFSVLPGNLLVESTPGGLAGVDETDAGGQLISGKKRSFTESTLTDQSLNSVESSRIIRSKRTVESVPDDDDLLSSILVGRRSSVLKVKPTPPCEIISSKRLRSALRTGSSKRKVLMDDTMVLHGDMIRKQLTNTEDIRRLRKKAPCTRLEISMIQNQFLEDEIFTGPVFTGFSLELASLHNRTYDLRGISVSLNDSSVPSLESVTDVKLASHNDGNNMDFDIENAADSRVPDARKESGREANSDPFVVRDGGEVDTINQCKMAEIELRDDHDQSLDADITRLSSKPSESNNTLLEPSADGADVETNERNISFADAENPAEDCGVGSSRLSNGVSGGESIICDDALQTVSHEKTDRGNASVHEDELIVSGDQKADEASIQMDAFPSDVNIRIEADHSTLAESNDDCIDEVRKEDKLKDGVLQKASEDIVAFETETNTDGQGLEDNAQTINDTCNHVGEPAVETCPPESSADGQYVSLNDGENLMQEDFPSHTMDAEVSGTEHDNNLFLQQVYPADATNSEIPSINVYDHSDLKYLTAENDTEFLNFDDDEDVADVADDYVPKAEEPRITENSGWSSRTRAVGKYLQTLFIKEAEYGRQGVSMDGLLIGKTRKEASRMFFETLVLKTRDYIQVEQVHPFDDITMKPRMKLTKSDF